MRKRLVTLVALAVILGLAIPAGAVELHKPHQGIACGKNQGDFYSLHFVNNRLKGYNGDVFLWVKTNTETIGPLAPDKLNRNNVQWTVTLLDTPDPLTGNLLYNAWTTTTTDAIGDGVDPITSDGPGKLVLSDYKCKLGGGTQEP